MRKLLNMLHVLTQGAYLHRDGETVSVIPIHTLEGLVCHGQIISSPAVLELCCEHGVGVSFLTEQGRFMARVSGRVSGNVLLRRRQYRVADEDSAALPIVQAILAAKLSNSRLVLLRGARETANEVRQTTLRDAADRLSVLARHLLRSSSINEARGYEGLAAQIYFSAFDCLLPETTEAFRFGGRSRRPSRDRVNALLSFVYALLRHDIESALEAVGLDPAVGFLHRDRPGRPGLALDLMEELRPHLGDRLVLSLINRRQVRSEGFREEDGGGILMDEETRREVISAWQRRKQEEILHPYLQEHIPLGLVPHTQSLLLARYLRNGLDAYPAFFWR